MKDSIQSNSEGKYGAQKEHMLCFGGAVSSRQDLPDVSRVLHTARVGSSPVIMVAQTLVAGLPRLGVTGKYSLVYTQCLLDTYRYPSYHPQAFWVLNALL